MSSAEEEGRQFTLTIDKAISQHPNNKELEDVLIEVELIHKKHINAIKAEFNKDLDRYDGARKSLFEDRERDQKQFSQDLKRISADYKGQLDRTRENYVKEVKRLKSHYESLLDDRKHAGRVVSRLQEDHDKELKRVNTEWERIVGNKDREIARLTRRMEQTFNTADEEIQDQELRRRMTEEEVNLLRRQVLNLQSDVHAREAQVRDNLTRHVEEQSRLVKANIALLNDFQNSHADLEVALSKMRAVSIDQDYQNFRARLRQQPSAALTAEDLKKCLDDLEARREQEKQDLAALLDVVAQARESQETILGQYDDILQQELARLHDMQSIQFTKSAANSSSAAPPAAGGSTTTPHFVSLPRSSISTPRGAQSGSNTPNAASRGVAFKRLDPTALTTEASSSNTAYTPVVNNAQR